MAWERIFAPDVPEVPAFAHAAIAGDTVYLAAYHEVFGARTPARIAVGCAALLFGARVEFDCVAHRP